VRKSISEILDDWYMSDDEILRLGRDLLASGYLADHNVTADKTTVKQRRC